MVDPILLELQRNSRIAPETLATMFNLDLDTVKARIAAWEADGTIIGYPTVVDPERAGHTGVTAQIEVRLQPERGGGFDRTATRISKFDQVKACYLMSGGYDLSVVVEGDTLQDVAQFVSEKLSTIEGVLSTATHFLLKVYKQDGFPVESNPQTERLSVAP